MEKGLHVIMFGFLLTLLSACASDSKKVSKKHGQLLEIRDRFTKAYRD